MQKEIRKILSILNPRAYQLCKELYPLGVDNNGIYTIVLKNNIYYVDIPYAQWKNDKDESDRDYRSGDLIDFIMQMKGLSIENACIYAKDFLGIDESKPYYRAKPLPIDYSNQIKELNLSIKELSQTIKDHFHLPKTNAYSLDPLTLDGSW